MGRPAPNRPSAPGRVRVALGLRSSSICVAEKATKMANSKLSALPGTATAICEAIKEPSTMPGANEAATDHSTAPRAWCARTEEMEVMQMVASDVATAILITCSAGACLASSSQAMAGTMIMPPPMPSNPAKNPVTMPKAASSKIRVGSSGMGWGKKVSAAPPDRHPEPGFRWARSDWRWVRLTRDDHARQTMFQARAL